MQAKNAHEKLDIPKKTPSLFASGRQSTNFDHKSAHIAEKTCGPGAGAAHHNVKNPLSSPSAEVETHHRAYILESDIKKICFHELFKQDSCQEKREKCSLI